MLQQTQVARVLEKFPLWLQKFPTIEALAKSSKRSVLLAWSGMGYNRRALNLHEAAKRISREYGGCIPSSPEELRALPGFGKYTAAAVACFGYRKRVPMVDINIRRVLSRLVAIQKFESDLLPEKVVWELAAEMLPPRAYYNWNQALMDFGSHICTASGPKCDICSLQRTCASTNQMRTQTKTRTKRTPEVPRRIYRGRVVEFLRSEKGNTVQSFHAIGKHLRGDFGTAHHAWLADILHTLQADGMIDLEARKRPIVMDSYRGLLATIRVKLAQ